MLIKSAPDTYDKLRILGGMAGDDVLSRSEDGLGRLRGTGRGRMPYSAPRNNPIPGVYRAAMPNGKYINLMRVMFTDFCKMDCAYCPNSHWVPRKRYAFKVDELAKAFMELHQRHTVNGLFLSSGIAGSGSKTTERLINVVEVIRKKYGFKGYVHMKVMPGTEYQYVEAAHRLGTRLSVNIETPTVEGMQRLSAMKDMEGGILAPMQWVDSLTRSSTNGAVGQATQMVVGAADESDWDIFQRIDQLYGDWNLKRVYYVAFRPVRYTPLEEHPPTPPEREHRLYQMDWLRRVYGFPREELGLAFNKSGFLDLESDPKTAIALERIDAFPFDVNSASHEQLLRVPGVGTVSAQRIVENRGHHSIDNWRDLQAMGVVRKRAWPFLVFPGHRPPRAKQLKLELFKEDAGPDKEYPTRKGAASPGAYPGPGTGRVADGISTPTDGNNAVAPCGLAGSCAGCSMYGAPGHPGYSG